MDVVNPALCSADMQSAAVEVNLIPAQAADFRSAKPVPVRNQDHGSVAMAIAGSLAGGLLEPLDLPFGQVFPGLELGALRGTVRFAVVEGACLRADFAM